MSQNKTFTCFSEKLIADLEWKVFEDLCCAYFSARDVRAEATGEYHTSRVADIYLYKDGEDAPYTIVRCKAWHAKRVESHMVKELLDTMQASYISRGIIMSSGIIPVSVRNFVRGIPITLISGHGLFKLIQALPIEAQQQLLRVATPKGYNIPTCSLCGLKMERSMHYHGANKGEYYWRCLDAPECLHTMQMH